MARPVKSGLDYFPFDTDFFSDVKIKRLRARYGSDGIAVYLYMICGIYRSGYCMPADGETAADIVAELGTSEGKTRQILKYLFDTSLLVCIRSDTVNVTTAVSVQRRYQEAVKQRALKNPVVVKERFWLLPPEETKDYISVCDDEGKPVNDRCFSVNNSGFSEEKRPKEKENKTKENEMKEKAPRAPAARERAQPPQAAGKKRNYDLDKLAELSLGKVPHVDKDGNWTYK